MHWVANFDKLGPCRVNHAAVICGDVIYSFGGFSDDLDKVELKYYLPIDVHALNTTTFKWTKRPLPKEGTEQYGLTPYFRFGHTCVYYNEHKLIYLWGGSASGSKKSCNTLFAYNPKTHEWSHVKVFGDYKPLGRDGHSATIVGNSMYIFGGFIHTTKRYDNELNQYNFDTSTWTLIKLKTPLKPNHRDFHTATAIGHKIYLFGGRMDRGGDYHTGEGLYSNTMFVFDTIKHYWKEVISQNSIVNGKTYVPAGRRSHTAIVYGNRIVFYGGFTENVYKHFNDLFEFNTDTYEWREIKAQGLYPSLRRRHCCCVHKNRMFLFGGTGPGPVDKIPEISTPQNDLINVPVQNIEIFNNDNINPNNNNIFDNNDIVEVLDVDVVENDDDSDDSLSEFYFDDDDDLTTDEDDDDFEDLEKKLIIKADLHILDLDVTSLKGLAIEFIIKNRLDFKNSYLPKALKMELSNYANQTYYNL